MPVINITESELVFEPFPKNKLGNVNGKFIDRTGNTFSRLTILGYAGDKWWFCKCECGNIASIHSNKLVMGDTKSCGCLRSEKSSKRMKKHGLSRIPEQRVWNTMIQRCTNPSNKNFDSYGGRGVAVCERWRIFANFIADMGRRPSAKHSIDRIKNNGNYEPSNCKWATKLEQANNTRTNVYITIDGITKTIAQWCRELGTISADTAQMRMKRDGWCGECAVTVPRYGKRCTHKSS